MVGTEGEAALGLNGPGPMVAPQKKEVNVVSLEGVSYKTTTGFNIAGLGVIVILVALYAIWW